MLMNYYSWLRETQAREHTMLCNPLSMHGRQYEFAYRHDFPDNWPDDATFTAEGTAPEDVPFSFLWPLVSDRLRRLIEANDLTGAKFYPVQVISELPVPIPRYWYIHFKHLEGAIDFERSTWRRMNLELPTGGTEHRISIVKYVLKRKAIEGWDLFRCIEEGKFASEIFCSGRFRDLFVENGCTGLGFSRVRVSE